MDSAAVLSHPCVDAIGLLSDFKYSSASGETVRAIASITCFAAESKSDALISPIVVIVMIVACKDPFDSFLLFERPKESGVDGATTYFFSLESIEGIVIVKIHVFTNGNMNEQESFALGGIIKGYLVVLLAEPFYLVGPHTVPTFLIQAILMASV